MILHTFAPTTVLAAGCAAVTLTLAGPASAVPDLTTAHFVQVCQPPVPGASPQSCRGPLQKMNVAAGEPVTVRVEFTASPGHCSDINVLVYLDDQMRMNNPVGPGQSTSQSMSLSPGDHAFTVFAEGIRGGCNTGKLGSWEGDLRVSKVG